MEVPQRGVAKQAAMEVPQRGVQAAEVPESTTRRAIRRATRRAIRNAAISVQEMHKQAVRHIT
jgi:hypothetical protein